MLRIAVVVLLGLGITSCQTASADKIVYGDEIPMTKDFAGAVDQAVRSNLKDPYSAVMGPARARARIRNGVKEIVVCGYVNAKNGFGGYNGQQIYIGIYSQQTQRFQIVTMGDQSPNAALMVSGACRTAGIPVS